MNQQQSTRHAEPSPYIHSNVRRFVAPEMMEKPPRPVAPVKEIGMHELGRILNAKIKAKLEEGGRYTVVELHDAFGSSRSTVRRHLDKMVDTGFADATDKAKNSGSNGRTYWKAEVRS